MSDQPEPDFVPASPAVLRDIRWIAAGIWAGMLFALGLTSYAAVAGGGVDSSVNLSYLSFLSIFIGEPAENEPNPDLVITVALIASAIVAVLLLLAWLRFATATFSLLRGLNDASDDPEGPTAANEWLPLGPGRSPVVEVIGLLGLTWLAIVMRPIVTTALLIYTT